MTDPLGRFSRDVAAASRDLADVEEPRRIVHDELAERVAAEAPRKSGALAGSVVSNSDGVEVTVPYGGVIAFGSAARNITANPYHERAIDAVDWSAPFAEHAIDVLNDNLHRSYS